MATVKKATTVRAKAVTKVQPATVAALEPAVVADPKTVVVLGREIEVKRPTPEQIYLLEDLAEGMVNAGKVSPTYQRSKDLTQQFYRIVRGLFSHEADRLWLTEGQADGTVSISFEEVAVIPQRIIEVWKTELSDSGNREQRRAAARRKSS